MYLYSLLLVIDGYSIGQTSRSQTYLRVRDEKLHATNSGLMHRLTETLFIPLAWYMVYMYFSVDLSSVSSPPSFWLGSAGADSPIVCQLSAVAPHNHHRCCPREQQYLQTVLEVV